MVKEEESCGNCQFYMAGTKVCRRYPPVALMVGIKKGIAQLANDEPLVMSYFPHMMPQGWCGEYLSIDPPKIEN